MIRKIFLMCSVSVMATQALADPMDTTCGDAVSCTVSNQTMGDTSSSALADHSTSTSSMAGNSSASNQSGNSITTGYDNSAQTTQNATTKTGDVSSTGGASSSSGNYTSSQNSSSANTGASTSSSGATTGASTSNSGGNILKSGRQDQTNNVTSTGDARNSGGNSAVNIDTSDKSNHSYIDKSRVTFIPPVVPPTPPSHVAIGNIIKETLACGPLQKVVKTPITGTSRGLFSRTTVNQGYTYDLEPFIDNDGNMVDYRRVYNPDGSIQLFGHQVVMFATIVGLSSGGNFAIGGGGGGGAWGQGGFGTSSSNTRLVTNIQLVQCEIGTFKPTVEYIMVPDKKIKG